MYQKLKLIKKEVPFVYRVHDTPDEVKLLPFVAFAKKYGHEFDTSTPEGIAALFNKMLKEVQGNIHSNMCLSNWVYEQWQKLFILLKILVIMD